MVESKHLITLECPSCGGETNFAADASHFICKYCGNQHLLFLPSRSPEKAKKPRRPRLAPPRKVSLERDEHGLTVTCLWFNGGIFPLAVFYLVCYCYLLSSFIQLWEYTGMADFVFSLGLLTLASGLLYLALIGVVNRSTLRADRENIRVQHKPLSWRRGLTLPVQDLEQLSCEKAFGLLSDNEKPSYKLCAVLKDGRKLDVLSKLDSPEAAIFIEQQLESWLEITDREVVGELSIDDGRRMVTSDDGTE